MKSLYGQPTLWQSLQSTDGVKVHRAQKILRSAEEHPGLTKAGVLLTLLEITQLREENT